MASIDEALSKRLDDESMAVVGSNHSEVKKWLKVHRGHRQSVTKTANLVSSKNFTDLNEVKSLKEKCVYLWKELDNLDASIRDEMIANDYWDDRKCDMENAHCESYRDVLRNSTCRLDTFIQNLSANAPPFPNTTVDPSNSFNPKMNLPKLELPSFDGSPENYARFVAQFEAIMNKSNLTSFEKFTYLEKQLSGSARNLLNAVPLDNMRYEAAKELLDKAFLKEDIQKFAVLDRLVKLKMNEHDTFKWISDINMLKDQVDKLNIDSNFFLQYFAWGSLTENFRQQLISITNESRPSIDMIIDKSFEANTRLKQLGHSTVCNEPKAVSLATTVSKSVNSDAKNLKGHCTLCSKGDHFPKDCLEYPTSVKKVERAKSMNLCLKCARAKHKGNCYNLSRRCQTCKSWHFDFMCNAGEKSKVKSNNISTSKTKTQSNPSPVYIDNTSSSIVFPVNDDLQRDILLPTFTAKLKGKSKPLEVRSMVPSNFHFRLCSL